MNLDQAGAGHAGGTTLLEILVRYRWVVVLTPAVLILLAGFMAFRGRAYLARSSFKPEVSELSGGRLAGIAAQFGFDLGASGGGESVHFYAALVRSRRLLEEVVATEYAFATERGGPDSLGGMLIELYAIEPESPVEDLLQAVTRLRDDLMLQVDLDAGIVRVFTEAPWAELAEQINARILELVNTFNQQQRRSKASEERQFVEARLEEAQVELETAEEALRRFLDQNRSYQESPRLVFEAARLQRRVDIRQQVHASLAEAYERSSIEEVRNTPVFTPIDPPAGSAERVMPLFRNVFLALLASAVIVAAWIGFREYRSR